tara:strand:- start:2856 stop:3092 length:237 start_codon:yes stop_codon:yes gene_type:complete
MTEMFLGFTALFFVEHNAEFINKAYQNYKEGYVWEYNPQYITKDKLAIAFEGQGKRFVIWKQRPSGRISEVKIPLAKK